MTTTWTTGSRGPVSSRPWQTSLCIPGRRSRRVLWCQRGWFLALQAPVFSQEEGASAPAVAIIEGLQEAQARCADTSWGHVGRGIAALLQGHVAQASEA